MNRTGNRFQPQNSIFSYYCQKRVTRIEARMHNGAAINLIIYLKRYNSRLSPEAYDATGKRVFYAAGFNKMYVFQNCFPAPNSRRFPYVMTTPDLPGPLLSVVWSAVDHGPHPIDANPVDGLYVIIIMIVIVSNCCLLTVGVSMITNVCWNSKLTALSITLCFYATFSFMHSNP